MNLFPIGTVSAGSSSGSIDSVSYNFWEPNGVGGSSNVMHNVLTSMFEQQTILARKKSEPYLIIPYEYNDIFDREFKQIEHFVDSIEGALTPFWAVDFSRGQTPSSVADASGDWTVSIDNTRFYSIVLNQKASRAFLWDGTNWKEGLVSAISANTYIVVDVDTNNYGALTLANAANSLVYPLYEVFLSKEGLSAFKSTNYVNEKVTTSKDGGFIRSGSINLVTRYKV